MTGMNIKNMLIVGLTCGLGLFSELRAQESVAASGGNAVGSGGSVSYTIGQVFDQNQTGSGGSVAQGVQQPFEISVVTSNADFSDLQLVCTAFPNPTLQDVTLHASGKDLQNLTWFLYDLKGTELQSKGMQAGDNAVEISKYPAAAYLIKIRSGKREVKSYKIIKK